MISVATLSSAGGAAKYYDTALAVEANTVDKKADNYYVNEKANAIWQGEGAKLLGIEGEVVNKEDFVNYLNGKITNPKDGSLQNLADNSKGEDRRLGYDFTISAPKSVSIVGLVGGDKKVIEAHNVANATAMRWLEKNGAQIRVKDESGQNKVVNTGNLLYATVQHETSRENDPQLHNHNVIVGVSYDTQKGEWRSLTNDELFVIRAAGDSIYKNELARILVADGYELEYASNGRDFEIKGISKEQLDFYSERKEQLKEALEKSSISADGATYGERQTAALNSRGAKNDLKKDILAGIWEEKAKESGLDINKIVANAKSTMEKGPVNTTDVSNTARKAVSLAIEHLSEREQSFKVADLEVSAVFFGGGKIGMDDVVAAIDERKKDKSLVDRTNAKARTLTTSLAISQELTLQNSILESMGNGVQVITDQNEFNSALKVFEARKSLETNSTYKLSSEQVSAAQNVLMHPDKFQGIQGDAGTGKTAALEFINEASVAKGWQMKGIAITTTAAKELRAATGIESQTIAAFLQERDKQVGLLKSDLEKLTINLAHSPEHIARIKQVERRELNLKGKDGGFGTARYMFDNKTGDVFKSNTGPLNLLNILGHKLSDAGNQQSWDAQKEWKRAEKFSDRFKAKANLAAGKLKVEMGKQLTSYEKVGVSEAAAARTELNIQQIKEHNLLLRAYESKSAQIDNLIKTGNADGKKFMLVMDESSMTGTKDAARIVEIAKDLGARVVIQGDIKQHGSVAAGKALKQTQEAGINLSTIEETRRFDRATPQQKLAIKDMKSGRYADAIAGLDTVQVGTLDDLYIKTAERYIHNREELRINMKDKGHENIEPRVGIVALTNADRKGINIAVREKLKKSGELSKIDFQKEHLNDPKLTIVESGFVPSLKSKSVDRLTALKDYKSLGIKKEDVLSVVEYNTVANTLTIKNDKGKEFVINPEKTNKFSFAQLEQRSYSVGDQIEVRANIGRKNDAGYITNGTKGRITGINNDGVEITWKDGKKTLMNNQQLRHIDHAYARTTYKEQGVTNDRELFVVSEIGAMVVADQAAYVATSRARDNTEIITNAYEKLLNNVGRETKKTTAIDISITKEIGGLKPKDLDTDKQIKRNREVVRKEQTKDNFEIKQDKGKKEDYNLQR